MPNLRTPKKRSNAKAAGEVRLHKFIASSGLCSRRKAEDLISELRVQVNGQTVTEMGTKVSPGDEVLVDGKLIESQRHMFLLMNKPRGCVTTLHDPRGRPTVAKYLPKLDVVLKPVGRLDMDTEGLLIFTNDGDLAAQLTHPRYGVEKEYMVTVSGTVSPDALASLVRGVFIKVEMPGAKDGEKGRIVVHKATAERVAVERVDSRLGRTILKMVIHEGKKRQVRLMMEEVGNPVISLKRVRIGPIILRDLAPGECRMLGMVEVDKLRKAVNAHIPEVAAKAEAARLRRAKA